MRTLVVVCVALSALVGCGTEMIQGQPGPQGEQGAAGAQGPAGDAGAPGANGANGANGSSTLMVVARSTSLVDCGGGPGVTVQSFTDADGSGTVTPGDPLVAQAVVCDGATGAQGPAGDAGTSGANGSSTLMVVARSTSLADCDGGSGVTVQSFTDADGSGTVTPGDPLVAQAVVCDGATGAQGPAGDSCTVETVSPDPVVAPNGGALITCGSTSTLLLNGAPGEPGPQGEPGTPAPPTAFSVVDVIDPCGPQGGFDEVFLRLANGTVVASFSDNAGGTNTRLSVLVDGSFTTSDGTNCAFTITTNTSVTPHTRTITWTGGSQTWTLSP